MDNNRDISVKELKALIDSGEEFNFYDVRNEDEFEEDNLGATLIPLGDLGQRMEELEAIKDDHIYIHCRSGARSGRAKEYLEQEGFENVHNVLGGILAYRAL
ncbi:MAG: rhodanese-related sulfurtransferase [Algoriphagus sp.]|jgi:rhodanese-related sulfurtransferase